MQLLFGNLNQRLEGYPSWTFVKTATCSSKNTNSVSVEERKNKRNNIVIPYVSGVSEKLRRIFNEHHIPVFFKPSNMFRQKLVHPKDRTPHTQKSNLVYAVQCSEECKEHRRANSSGQDSTVYLHLKDMAHSFEDSNVHILDREDRWCERGVKEAIYVKVEKPSLNRVGRLGHHLSLIYNAALSFLPRRFNNLTSKNNGCSQMALRDSNDSDDSNDCHYNMKHYLSHTLEH